MRPQRLMEQTMMKTLAIAAALGGLLLVPTTITPVHAQDAREAFLAEFASLNAMREAHRETVLALPGVVGLSTEVRDGPPQTCVIAVYVLEDTPALRASIGTEFRGVPYEIIERPGGFRAF